MPVRMGSLTIVTSYKISLWRHLSEATTGWKIYTTHLKQSYVIFCFVLLCFVCLFAFFFFFFLFCFVLAVSILRYIYFSLYSSVCLMKWVSCRADQSIKENKNTSPILVDCCYTFWRFQFLEKYKVFLYSINT